MVSVFMAQVESEVLVNGLVVVMQSEAKHLACSSNQCCGNGASEMLRLCLMRRMLCMMVI